MLSWLPFLYQKKKRNPKIVSSTILIIKVRRCQLDDWVFYICCSFASLKMEEIDWIMLSWQKLGLFLQNKLCHVWHLLKNHIKLNWFLFKNTFIAKKVESPHFTIFQFLFHYKRYQILFWTCPLIVFWLS